jgi:hypothetical protein
MSRVRLALAAGLAVTAIAIAVVLSPAPLTLAGTNGIQARPITFIHHSETRCQGGGTLPQGTTAIRVSLSANLGPRVSLQVLSGSAVVTKGEREAGWGEDETVTVPVARVPRRIPDARICTTIGPLSEFLQINGARVQTSAAGGHTILLRMEYLRPGHTSWLSLASSVARHMGIGHAPSGTWVAFLILVLMLTAGALASRLILRELDE